MKSIGTSAIVSPYSYQQIWDTSNIFTNKVLFRIKSKTIKALPPATAYDINGFHCSTLQATILIWYGFLVTFSYVSLFCTCPKYPGSSPLKEPVIASALIHC